MNGLLLINLGTPEHPTVPAVRRYLREFLSDPRVLDMPSWKRWLLLNLIILPRRSKQSAAVYRKIWTDEGSPLLLYTQALSRAVQARFGDTTRVECAMRYGTPSIHSALERFQQHGVSRLVVFPLYPQYATSSYGSSIEAVYRLASQYWNSPSLYVIPPFYDHPGYIEAFSEQGRALIDEVHPDWVLFSYHGLPERHCLKSDLSRSHCLKTETCCETIRADHPWCYRAHCYATTHALVEKLSLPANRWSISFQSRLGRERWIHPYTDHVITELAQKGCKRVVVFSPAFVADCLETLEEIAISLNEQFIHAGGEKVWLVPSLNANPRWVDAVVDIACQNCPWLLTT